MKPHEAQYWEWGLDELGLFDFPAFVDHVTKYLLCRVSVYYSFIYCLFFFAFIYLSIYLFELFYCFVVFSSPALPFLLCRVTGHEKVVFVGHSQGNAQAFVGLSRNPQVAQKLELFVALAPAFYIGRLGYVNACCSAHSAFPAVGFFSY